MNNWLGLEGRIIIVTGGASGIGLAISNALRDAGAVVVSADISYKTETDTEVPCDITDRASVEHMIEHTVNTFGKIDGLINNAGMTLPRMLVDVQNPHSKYEINDAFFDKMINLNIKGTYLCAQEAARVMVKQNSGVIINISSECGKEGSHSQSIYSGTKSAIESFARSWAKELGGYGIRVLAVAPGPMEATGVWTDAYRDAISYCRHVTMDDVRKSYKSSTLLHREGKLTEVADTVAFLVSDRASYITGTTVNVSGGKSRG